MGLWDRERALRKITEIQIGMHFSQWEEENKNKQKNPQKTSSHKIFMWFAKNHKSGKWQHIGWRSVPLTLSPELFLLWEKRPHHSAFHSLRLPRHWRWPIVKELKRFLLARARCFFQLDSINFILHSFLWWFYDKVGVKHSIGFGWVLKDFSIADFIKIYVNTFAILMN